MYQAVLLFKYDKEGNLIAKNETPFDKLEKKANHFGDIDFYREIYTGIEIFSFGTSENIQVAVYDVCYSRI